MRGTSLEPKVSYTEQQISYKRFMFMVTILEFIILTATYISTVSLYVLGPILLIILFVEHHPHKLLLMSICCLIFSSALLMSPDSSILSMNWFSFRQPLPISTRIPDEMIRITTIVVHYTVFIACVYHTTSVDTPIFSLESWLPQFVQQAVDGPEGLSSQTIQQYGRQLRDLTTQLQRPEED